MPRVETWRDWAPIGRFAPLHLSALSIFLVPFEWSLVGWLTGSYALRMFGVTAGYHRYFRLCRFAAGGLSALVWGYLLATVLLYHATFAINSVAHVWGTRRFATGDDSRNNWWLAIATLGEGWHNNHHYCMSSSRQGIRWWEFDATYLGLRALEAVGIARDLRPFVERVSLSRASGRDIFSSPRE